MRTLYMLMAVGSLMGCGTPLGDGQAPLDVQSYFKDLPGWAQTHPLRDEYQSSDKETDLGTGVIRDRKATTTNESRQELLDGVMQSIQYACTTKYWTLSRNPEAIAYFDLDKDAIWPGALLQGKDYAEGVGSLKELPIRQRAPLKLFVDLLKGQTSELVSEPDAASIHQAVGKIVEEAKAAGTNIGGAASYTAKEFSSSTQIGLEVANSAKFFNVASLETDFRLQQSNTKKTVTAYYVQRAYTASVVAPQSPAAFFNDQFNQAALEEQTKLGRIGKDNLPVYIASVTYGRVLAFNVSAQGSSTDISAYIKVGFDLSKLGADISSSLSRKAAFQRIKNTLEIKVAGTGSSRSVEDAIKSGKIQDYFSQPAPTDSYVPISFTVRNLGDGSLAKVSETTNYTVRECKPVNAGDVVITLLSLELLDGGGDATYIDGYGTIALANRTAWELPYSNPYRVGDGTILYFNDDGIKYGMKPENATYATRLVKGGPGIKIVGNVKDHDHNSGDDTLGDYDITVQADQNIEYGRPQRVLRKGTCHGLFEGAHCYSALNYRIDLIQ